MAAEAAEAERKAEAAHLKVQKAVAEAALRDPAATEEEKAAANAELATATAELTELAPVAVESSSEASESEDDDMEEERPPPAAVEAPPSSLTEIVNNYPCDEDSQYVRNYAMNAAVQYTAGQYKDAVHTLEDGLDEKADWETEAMKTERALLFLCHAVVMQKLGVYDEALHSIKRSLKR